MCLQTRAPCCPLNLKVWLEGHKYLLPYILQKYSESTPMVSGVQDTRSLSFEFLTSMSYPIMFL